MSANDVIIIGAGPAGIAAAIQLKRSGLNPVVFEKKKIGGLLNNANLVENYPGFPGGITGPDLAALFKEQLESFEIEIIYEQIKSLDYNNELFTARTESKEMQSKAAIIASGTRPKRSNDLKISDRIKSKIYYDVSNLLEANGKTITIIGAGDAAFDYALNLAKKNNVIILNRGKNIECLPLLYDRIKEAKSIKYQAQTQVLKITEFSGNRLILKCRKNNEDVDIISDCVILAIGREVQFDFMTENLKERRGELEKEGLFHFIGDVNGRIYRQTAIAVGEGILAAMKIERKHRDLLI